MRTARPIALLVGIALALVLLTACSAPSVRQTPAAPPDTRVVFGFTNADLTGNLEALDVNTGQLLWKTQAGVINYPSRPTIAHGVVYAIVSEHYHDHPQYVVAVRESDGKLLWRIPSPSSFPLDSIRVDTSTIELVSTTRELYALDPATGAERWHVAVQQLMGGMMRNGVIYVSVSQALMALNERDGSLLWQVRDDVGFIPWAVTDRAIYGWGGDNHLWEIYAFDAWSGRQLAGGSSIAGRTPGSTIFATGQLMGATDRIVLLSDVHSTHTRALSDADGKVLWDVPVNLLNAAAAPAGILITDDFIYSEQSPNSITAVRVRDGSVAWRWSFGADCYPTGLSVIGGSVFVMFAMNSISWRSDPCEHLASLNAATGKVNWQHDLPSPGNLAVPAQ